MVCKGAIAAIASRFMVQDGYISQGLEFEINFINESINYIL